MALLDGLASILASAVTPFYRDGILWRRPDATDDGAGSVTVPDASDWPQTPVKVQIEACTDAMRRAEGYTDRDVRLIVLAVGVAQPSTDDELTVEDNRYSIASVDRDAAGAYWDLHGRLA